MVRSHNGLGLLDYEGLRETKGGHVRSGKNDHGIVDAGVCRKTKPGADAIAVWTCHHSAFGVSNKNGHHRSDRVALTVVERGEREDRNRGPDRCSPRPSADVWNTLAVHRKARTHSVEHRVASFDEVTVDLTNVLLLETVHIKVALGCGNQSRWRLAIFADSFTNSSKSLLIEASKSWG